MEYTNLRGIGLVGRVYGGSDSSIVSAPGVLRELQRFFSRDRDERMTILTDGPANIVVERIGGNIYLTFVQSNDNKRITGLTDLYISMIRLFGHTEKEKIGHALAEFFAGRMGKSAHILTKGRYDVFIRHKEEDSFFFSVY